MRRPASPEHRICRPCARDRKNSSHRPGAGGCNASLPAPSGRIQLTGGMPTCGYTCEDINCWSRRGAGLPATVFSCACNSSLMHRKYTLITIIVEVKLPEVGLWATTRRTTSDSGRHRHLIEHAPHLLKAPPQRQSSVAFDPHMSNGSAVPTECRERARDGRASG